MRSRRRVEARLTTLGEAWRRGGAWAWGTGGGIAKSCSRANEMATLSATGARRAGRFCRGPGRRIRTPVADGLDAVRRATAYLDAIASDALGRVREFRGGRAARRGPGRRGAGDAPRGSVTGGPAVLRFVDAFVVTPPATGGDAGGRARRLDAHFRRPQRLRVLKRASEDEPEATKLAFARVVGRGRSTQHSLTHATHPPPGGRARLVGRRSSATSAGSSTSVPTRCLSGLATSIHRSNRGVAME